jgi:hypothetical protein
MNRLGRIAAAVALTVLSASSYAQMAPGGNVEDLRYSWRLKGGMRFVAGLMFPTSGVGNLTTTFGDQVESELVITAPNGRQGGFYAYESKIDSSGKTLETYHGYAWNDKSRHERTVFDYGKGLARIQKTTPQEVENRVKKLPSADGNFRDILTAIYFLRQNASRINAPLQTNIFSDGKEYPVVFKPGANKVFRIEGRNVNARSFEIVDAPGGKKWPGGVTVWVTSDDQRIPVRIEIRQSVASLQLDLQKIESSTMMAKL